EDSRGRPTHPSVQKQPGRSVMRRSTASPSGRAGPIRRRMGQVSLKALPIDVRGWPTMRMGPYGRLLRRPKNPSTPRPERARGSDAGSGRCATGATDAKPVTKALPEAEHPGWAQAKPWIATGSPLAFGASTSADESQVPPVFVRTNRTSVAACVKPSLLLRVWLNEPKPSTTPLPPSPRVGFVQPLSTVD